MIELICRATFIALRLQRVKEGLFVISAVQLMSVLKAFSTTQKELVLKELQIQLVLQRFVNEQLS